MNNRNTTIAGIGSILVAIGSVLTAMFDGDPATNADFTSAVAAVIAGVGLILAKDADKELVAADPAEPAEPQA